MDIINNSTNILNPTYLTEFCTTNAIPKAFDLTENIDKIKDELKAFRLGVYLFKRLTKQKYSANNLETIPEIKKAGIYQYLQATLQKDVESIIGDSQYLKELLNLANSDIKNFNQKLDNGSIIDEYSTVGLVRDINQDSLKTFHLGKLTILMVADGVGGGEHGEVASKIACETVLDNLKNKNYAIKTDDEIKTLLKESILKANSEVISYADKSNIDTIGTTLSITLIYKQKLFIGHVGDSRIYRIRAYEEPELITQDHSLPEVLFRLGNIKKEEKKNYKKNILVYVIGKKNLKEEDIYISKEANLSHADVLFLCTDGIWGIKGIENKFTYKSEKLTEYILNTIPSDNATLIRFQI